MQQYTTTPARHPQKASSNGYKPLPTSHEYQITRKCEHCATPLKATARRDARFCSETCRAAAYDIRTGRRAHIRKGEA